MNKKLLTILVLSIFLFSQIAVAYTPSFKSFKADKDDKDSSEDYKKDKKSDDKKDKKDKKSKKFTKISPKLIKLPKDAKKSDGDKKEDKKEQKQEQEKKKKEDKDKKQKKKKLPTGYTIIKKIPKEDKKEDKEEKKEKKKPYNPFQQGKDKKEKDSKIPIIKLPRILKKVGTNHDLPRIVSINLPDQIIAGQEFEFSIEAFSELGTKAIDVRYPNGDVDAFDCPEDNEGFFEECTATFRHIEPIVGDYVYDVFVYDSEDRWFGDIFDVQVIDFVDEEQCREDLDDAWRDIGRANAAVWEVSEQLRLALGNAREERELRAEMQEEMDKREEAIEHLRDLQDACNIYEEPDLIISDVRLEPTPAVSREGVTLSFDYTNIGDAPVYGEVPFAFFVPQEGDMGVSYTHRVRPEPREELLLAPGETKTWRAENVGVPFEPGMYNYELKIDGCLWRCSISEYDPLIRDGAIPESNERNNIFEGEVEVVEAQIQNGDMCGDLQFEWFTDFESPFDKRFFDDTFEQVAEFIDEQTDGNADFFLKHFPLNYHPNAHVAAQSYECVKELHEVHGLIIDDYMYVWMQTLFDHQEDGLDIDSLKRYFSDLMNIEPEDDAEEVIERFNQCLDNEETRNTVDAHIAEAVHRDVRGVPSFFVDGFQITGAQPFNVFEEAINDAVEVRRQQFEEDPACVRQVLPDLSMPLLPVPPEVNRVGENTSFELSVRVDGHAEGRLCYEESWEFNHILDVGEDWEQVFPIICDDEVRVLNNPEPLPRFDMEFEEPGRYTFTIRFWAEDEDGDVLVEQDMDNNSETLVWQVLGEPQVNCEAEMDRELRELGELHDDLWHAQGDRDEARIELNRARDNGAPQEEIDRLQREYDELNDEFEDISDDAENVRENIRTIMNECNNNPSADLVIQNVELITNPIVEGSEEALFEVTFANEGDVTVYGPYGFTIWYEDDRRGLMDISYSIGLEQPLRPGQVKTKELSFAARSILNNPGEYDMWIAIDDCEECEGLGVMMNNIIPESNEENNVWEGQVRVVADDLNCEEDTDAAFQELGENNNQFISLQIQLHNAEVDYNSAVRNNEPQDVIDRLEQALQQAEENFNAFAEDLENDREELRELMQQCDFNPSPDLVVTNIELLNQPLVVGDERMSFEITFRNDGNQSVYGRFGTNLWINDEHGEIYGSKELHNNVRDSPLRPGEEETFNKTIIGLENLVLGHAGHYNISVGIDICRRENGACDENDSLNRLYMDVIPESNEENNILEVEFDILEAQCPDPDNDGFCMEEDNCPFIANDQSDVDNDGVGDVCDEDDDNDGVFDDEDNCPFIPNPAQENLDGDDEGDICDIDDDNDGVVDENDNCPLGDGDAIWEPAVDDNPDQTDTDGDNIGDICDGDNIPIDFDTYPEYFFNEEGERATLVTAEQGPASDVLALIDTSVGLHNYLCGEDDQECIDNAPIETRLDTEIDEPNQNLIVIGGICENKLFMDFLARGADADEIRQACEDNRPDLLYAEENIGENQAWLFVSRFNDNEEPVFLGVTGPDEACRREAGRILGNYDLHQGEGGILHGTSVILDCEGEEAAFDLSMPSLPATPEEDYVLGGSTEFDLVIDVSGNAEGRLCYQESGSFTVPGGNNGAGWGRAPVCEDDVRILNESEEIGPFSVDFDQVGEYTFNIEFWLEDADENRINEINNNNNEETIIWNIEEELVIESEGIPFETINNSIEIQERIGAVRPFFNDNDLSGLSTGRLQTSHGNFIYEQELRFERNERGTPHFIESGAVVFEENENDVVGDYLKFTDNDIIFDYIIDFNELEVNVDQTGRLRALEGQTLNMLGDVLTIIYAEISGTEIMLDLIKSLAEDTMEEGDIRTYRVDGIDHEVTFSIMDENNDEVIFIIDGERTPSLEEGDSTRLQNGLWFLVTDVIDGQDRNQAEFILGSNAIEIVDDNFTDIQLDNDVSVNNEHIDAASAMITGSVEDNVLTLRHLNYRLRADAPRGDIYLAASESLRQYLDEPEGMLTETWDIRYDGLIEPDYDDISFDSNGSHDKYILEFTNIDGFTYEIPFIDNSQEDFRFMKWGSEDEDLIYSETTLEGDLQKFIIDEDDSFILNKNGKTDIISYQSIDLNRARVQFKYELDNDGERGEQFVRPFEPSDIPGVLGTGTISVGGNNFTFHISDPAESGWGNVASGLYPLYVDLNGDGQYSFDLEPDMVDPNTNELRITTKNGGEFFLPAFQGEIVRIVNGEHTGKSTLSIADEQVRVSLISRAESFEENGILDSGAWESLQLNFHNPLGRKKLDIQIPIHITEDVAQLTVDGENIVIIDPLSPQDESREVGLSTYGVRIEHNFDTTETMIGYPESQVFADVSIEMDAIN